MSTLEAKRRQLQLLYLDCIEADGIGQVHRLLSEALINRRAKTKKKSPPKREPVRNPPKPKGPTTTMWKGTTLKLGPAMRVCTPRGQLFVLGIVHDGLNVTAAARLAGYRSKCDLSPTIQAAIAEEKCRVM